MASELQNYIDTHAEAISSLAGSLVGYASELRAPDGSPELQYRLRSAYRAGLTDLREGFAPPPQAGDVIALAIEHVDEIDPGYRPPQGFSLEQFAALLAEASAVRLWLPRLEQQAVMKYAGILEGQSYISAGLPTIAFLLEGQPIPGYELMLLAHDFATSGQGPLEEVADRLNLALTGEAPRA